MRTKIKQYNCLEIPGCLYVIFILLCIFETWLLCISNWSQTHSNLTLALVSRAVVLTKCVPFQALDSEDLRQS